MRPALGTRAPRHRILDLAEKLTSRDGIPSLEARKEIARRVLAPVRRYPKQWAMVRLISRGKLVCVQANRRAGKTQGVIRWILAQCLASPKPTWSCMILAKHLAGPTDTVLDSGKPDSLVALLAEHGLMRPEVVQIQRSQGSIKKIRFAWGAQIQVVDAGTADAIDKKRGTAVDAYWADEAQSQHLLVTMLTKIVGPSLSDYDAKVILSGTPSADVDSFFRRVSLGLEPAWERAELWSWDNPCFGATPEERWRRILNNSIEAFRGQYGLTDDDVAMMRDLTERELLDIAYAHDDQLRPEVQEWVKQANPDLMREQFGRWLVQQSEYVFHWRNPNLHYARTEDIPGDLPVVRTMADRLALLPSHPSRQWYAAIGVDLGYEDGLAYVVMVFASNHQIAYELWSEKHTHKGIDFAFDRLVEIVEEVKGLGVKIAGVVADTKNSTKIVGATWDMQLRMRVPSGVMQARNLREKGRRDAMNSDLARGRIRVVRGSELDIEGSNFKWKPQDPDNPKPLEPWKGRRVTLPNGREARPGDHCLDALMYCMQDLDHIWAKEAEPPATVEEAREQERQKHLRRELQRGQRGHQGRLKGIRAGRYS